MQVGEQRGVSALVAQLCILIVIAVSLSEIVVHHIGLSIAAAGALAVYFLLSWRRFTVATWVPVLLSLAMLALALWRGVRGEVLAQGVDRMAFLAALLALLGMLRVIASQTPEIARAGRYLTSQPPGRRYWALNFGGHALGVLINLGGLAILLGMIRQAFDAASGLPDEIREWKLRRMTTSVLRGFAMVSLWSPMGFGINIMLLAMPGLSYFQIGPLGFALTFLFAALGWLVDRLSAPRLAAVPPTLPPDPADRVAVLRMLVHVIALAAVVLGLNFIAGLSFQQALLVGVPAYSLYWAALLGRFQPGGPAAAIRRTVGETVRRFPLAAGELGVFASAGLLSVLMLELLPVDAVRVAVADLQLSPWQLIIAANLTLFGLASVGINPIITASVMGSLVTRLDVPGLSQVAAALSMAGAWSCVMGFTPFITTTVFTGAVIGRPALTVGVTWNGLYCLSALVLWTVGMAAAVAGGLI